LSSPSRTTRPDPSLGVFETLLVRDGRPLELDAHLARLDASVRTLFGAPAPSTAPALVLEHARGEELARLRLTVVPHPGGTLVADVVVARVDPSLVFPSRDRGVELAPVVVARGIGAHKWADRRLLAGLEAEVAPAVPLLLDADGAVLEASRANLFVVVDDDALVTPPADGRILPGITRARVLQLADALDVPVREEAIALGSISTATEVFITGAVRGIEPVRACDGAVVESGDRITAELSRELDRLWEGGAAHARVD
jgi:para-aminobenzoate synthetase / 4-amino-4-deoxychorismate lyase